MHIKWMKLTLKLDLINCANSLRTILNIQALMITQFQKTKIYPMKWG